MTIIFKYEKVPRADGNLRHAPYIVLYARTKQNKSIKIIALVDSGADQTVIPKDLALLLGLKERGKAFKTGGIGGSVSVKESSFSFRIKGEHESYPLKVNALVLQDESADVPVILGRHGFFEEFHITIMQDKQKIKLKKVEPKQKYAY